MTMRRTRNVPPLIVGAALVGVFVFGVLGSVGLVPDGPEGVRVDATFEQEGSNQTLYYAELTLDGAFARSEVMSFGQDTISATISCYVLGASSTDSEEMEIQLHRVSFGCVDDYVSSVTVSREGSSTAVWKNVGAGDYYFKFIKDDDGQTVKSRALLLYSTDSA